MQHIATIKNWTVDYGDGHREIEVPHAWNQDVPVTWEGPATYRTTIEVSETGLGLLFHGISYSARVLVRGVPVMEHRGIWDAFFVALGDTGPAEIEVQVTKNGGPSFPVRDVLSGFLPYVYQTFGGIFRPVELVKGPFEYPFDQQKPSHFAVEGSKIYAEGRPIYPRGILSWGWYPELGHPHPDRTVIRREIATIAKLGFNLIKFCLWLPPHEYLLEMKDAGLHAWLELPLWDPSPDAVKQQQMVDEIERIVRQYRGHQNVLAWTIGCELSGTVTAGVRQELYEMVRRLTGSPLVKDNSGGAEMYGGDPREFGNFEDFHPYCEANFYPVVLDSLMLGSRIARPTLFGEFNDYDVQRNYPVVRSEQPYWASADEGLNYKGVRWQYDLPTTVNSRFAHDPDLNKRLMSSSREQATFIRKFVNETVRGHADFSGFVVTGWRDTPISTSGIVDDWGEPRFEAHDFDTWNGENCIFLIPQRQPPWVNGGNRPGWKDSFNHFLGPVLWKVGVHSEAGAEGKLEWSIVDCGWSGEVRPRGIVASGSGEAAQVDALMANQVGTIFWQADHPGSFLLRVSFGNATNSWRISVAEPFSMDSLEVIDPFQLLGIPSHSGPGSMLLTTVLPARLEKPTIFFALGEGTAPMPFWRECVFEWSAEMSRSGLIDQWEKLLAISTDRALAPELFGNLRVLINRIDTRTCAEFPLLVRGTRDGKPFIATSLRPFGGLGISPLGVARNPAGSQLLRFLVQLLEHDPNG